MIFILIQIFSFYHFLNLIKIFVEQYYSPKRLIKCQINYLFDKKIKYLVNTIFYLGFILIFYFFQNDFFLLIFLLINYLFIIKINLKNYHFTRRNLFLLVLSSAFNIISTYFLVYKVNLFVCVIFLIIINEFSFYLAFYCLLPIELLIRNHFIKKAHHKVLKNKYIVIGITGSFGKTTTKNFIYSFLKTKYLVSKQDHNYNTLMGLAKYINNEVKDEDQILLVELGVDEKNTMKNFKKLFSLDFAIVNSIGEMHLSTFKSLENIVQEKLSIRFLLKENGKLFLNQEIENQFAQYLNYPYQTYSLNEIDYQGECFYKIKYYDQIIQTNLITKFQLQSLVIALKIAKILNLNDYEILFSLNNIIIPSRRLQIRKKNNLLLIDNSYNANYLGIKEVINNLLFLKKKIIVLTGGLIELGDKYLEYNNLLSYELNKCEKVILITKNNQHPLIKTIFKNKLILKENIREGYNYINSLDGEYIVLLLAKGSDIYLK